MAVMKNGDGRPTIVLFDLDGVLVDFVRGTFAVHGKSLPPREVVWNYQSLLGFCGADDPAFWEPLSLPTFWSGLDPLSDGLALFRCVETALGHARLGLLSSGLCPGSCDGKRAWIGQHLPGYEPRAIFGTVKELLAAPCKLLVDDHDANVDAFRAAGGKAVLVPRPWNARRAETTGEGDFDVATVKAEILDLCQR